MVCCSVWQRKPGEDTEQSGGGGECGGHGGRRHLDGCRGRLQSDGSSAAARLHHRPGKESRSVGDILTDLDGRHYYGHWSLFGLVHSRDKEEIEAALPRIQNIFSDPAEAGLLEEKRGAVSAYFRAFRGNSTTCGKSGCEGITRQILSFVYSPFLGYPWSDDLQDEYTLVYETRQGTPFFFTPFVNGNGNTTVLGGPRRGKSLNTNALFTGAMK